MNVLTGKLRRLFHLARHHEVDSSLKRFERTLQVINRVDHGHLDECGLRSLVGKFRRRAKVEPLENLVVDVFATVREAASRVLQMRPYDVQVLAALALHNGRIVEMQTGEGKTLAAVLPACLHALSGRGVHVLTSNDYLAQRDAEWMGPVYRHLGFRVSYVTQGMSAAERRTAYGADVTYVTAKEAGFDFLRDQLCASTEEEVHRGFHFAIVDEADSILIDEARVPLVVAGQTREDIAQLGRIAQVVEALVKDVDYETDGECRNSHFTSGGLNRIQDSLGCGELHSDENVELLTRLTLALQAKALLHRDVDYIVRDGRIETLDEFTGRVVDNRRWPFGLQAALEAKEHVPVQPQGTILNSITLQHFLEFYDRRCGMTGTAQAAAEEFFEFYGMRTAVIPTHQPCIREDQSDLIFASKEAKNRAITTEVAARYRERRPVLVGTASVAESETLAAMLAADSVPCQILNAKNDRIEAEIVANAGDLGAVTISTNMAGRGTDIRLGGSDERHRSQVVELGGLCVIGTSRFESRRIDDQLRGRAGRQGDPGTSRFFVSLEDDLIRRYGVRDTLKDKHPSGSTPLDDTAVGERIAHIQRVIEGQCFEIRRTLRQYSFALEKQRRLIEQWRRELLTNESSSMVNSRLPERYQELVERFGNSIVRQVEAQIWLCTMNHAWSDHLEYVTETRDNIYLVSMGGLNAFDTYNQRINTAFRRLREHVDETTVNTFSSVTVTEQGVDLEKEGLAGPSSTWTYMINDNPMGHVFQRMSRSIKRLLKRT